MADHSSPDDAGPGDVLRELLDRHGQTFAAEAGITLKDTPSPLFELLVLSTLLSANLSSQLGVRATRALVQAGFTTAEHLADASDHDRWQVLSDAKYLRKEQTASRLGTLAGQALDRWGGDLRRLREDAGSDPAGIRDRLQDFTGIGAVGADIFCREVQAVWPALRPYADDRVTAAAGTLGLPTDAAGLARLAGTDDLSVLGAALVRSDLADEADEVRDDAGGEVRDDAD